MIVLGSDVVSEHQLLGMGVQIDLTGKVRIGMVLEIVVMQDLVDEACVPCPVVLGQGLGKRDMPVEVLVVA